MIEARVLISETESAPPARAARAVATMLVMLGVSLTITGIAVCALAQRVTISMYSGTWPTAAPMPRSDMPCGQPKLSSTPSAPVASTRFRIASQSGSVHGTISETTTARSGHSRLISAISRRLTSTGRSLMSSMLVKPAIRAWLNEVAP